VPTARVAYTAEDTDAALAAHFAPPPDGGALCVGFDIEMRPMFTKEARDSTRRAQQRARGHARPRCSRHPATRRTRALAPTPPLTLHRTRAALIAQQPQPPRRTALVQVASSEACLLSHVYHMPSFPQRLAALVEDAAVWKVGTGVVSDMMKLRQDYNVRAFVSSALVCLRFT
jgi:hypothetical protein